MIDIFILDLICKVECLADVLASKLKQFYWTHTFTARILGILIVQNCLKNLNKDYFLRILGSVTRIDEIKTTML